MQLLIRTKNPNIISVHNKLAQEIWTWAIRRDIWHSVAHVPGAWNTMADLQSWETTNNKVIQMIFKTFGKSEGDLFTSQLNAKCSKYVFID